ncbi:MULTISPECIES: ATP-binding protein [unclassified Saccharothrix]|uniref:ATP-binding protein n=1 Tax=unclassified Saccharothrix TaxID=2593673 RepID=UPI00307E15D8
MFVGAERRAEVARLRGQFEELRRDRATRMVVYVSPPGWGKTRIVQEFYRSLAEAQAAPAYWPESIVGEVSGGSTVELVAARKAIRPKVVASGGPGPDWLWLAVASGRLSDKSPAPALPALIEQIDDHRGEAATRGTAGPAEVAAVLARWGLPAVVVLDDAHDLDKSTVEFIEEAFLLRCPVLFIATTWSFANGAPNQFQRLLGRFSGRDGVTTVELAKLSSGDLAEFLLWCHPRTDLGTVHLLADRVDGNPYALRLMLNTPRVLSTIGDGRIALAREEIAELGGTLGDLLTEHWESLPVGVQQVLCVAALLGETLVAEVLEECLRVVGPLSGSQHALDSGWVRSANGSARVIEFAERMRHDHALSQAPHVLSRAQLNDVKHAALRAIKAVLRREDGDSLVRNTLVALHVTLAESGLEDDVVAAAGSATELAARARHEHRRLDTIRHLSSAIEWLSRSDPVPWTRLVECHLELSAARRTEVSRAAGEANARKALELAEDHLGTGFDIRIRARCALAMSRLRREDVDAYSSALRLLGECDELAKKVMMSPIARRDLLNARYSAAAQEGDYPRAIAVMDELALHCERHLGKTHHLTLEALESLGYSALRAGDVHRSIELRREILSRRTSIAPTAGRLQLASVSNNLAVTLLESGDDSALAEAEELARSALDTWAVAYGYDGLRPQRARLVLAWLHQRRGLAAEGRGENDLAAGHFRDAVTDTARIVELRRDDEPPNRANAFLRHGLSLACERRVESITVLGKALAVRQGELRQDDGFYEVRRCALALVWAYRRLGWTAEANAVCDRYGFPAGSVENYVVGSGNLVTN